MPYNADRYRERKEKGLCVRCGSEKDTPGVLCLKCKETGNESKRKEYEFYISIGVCPRCHKEKLYGDERACLDCATDRYKRGLKRDRDHANEIANKNHKRRYREASEKGICTRCNKRKAAEGQKRCKMCIERVNEYRRAKRIGIPRSERQEHGLCYLCGDKAEEGYKLCHKCHETITEANRKQDRSGRADFLFGRPMYDWDMRKRKEKAV